jgi:hypothetical protein
MELASRPSAGGYSLPDLQCGHRYRVALEDSALRRRYTLEQSHPDPQRLCEMISEVQGLFGEISSSH